MAVEKLRSPVGRVVWGHPKRQGKKINYTTKKPVLTPEGAEIAQWSCGVAFPKEEFQGNMWPYFHQESSTMYPNGVPKDFSWKFVDGDTIDQNGKPYSDREGYAGCIVLTVSTEAFCPPVYKFENGAYRELAENEIKCGDYVVLNANLKCHSNNSGGIYVNPNGFELVGYGTEIVSKGADANELFGGQEYQLPTGATTQPVSSAPADAQLPTGATTQPVQQQGQTQMAPPATDFVQNATGQVNSTQPVQVAVPQNQALSVQQPSGSAQNATTSPTNGMPGMPPAR